MPTVHVMPARVPVRILERGRVTIPADVREELDLEPGDRAWIEVEPIDDGENTRWIIDG